MYLSVLHPWVLEDDHLLVKLQILDTFFQPNSIQQRKPMSFQTVKKTVYFCEKHLFKPVTSRKHAYIMLTP